MIAAAENEVMVAVKLAAIERDRGDDGEDMALDWDARGRWQEVRPRKAREVPDSRPPRTQ